MGPKLLNTLLLAFLAAQLLGGQQHACISRLEQPVYPAFAWGFGNTSVVAVLARVQPDGKARVAGPDDNDDFNNEARRVIRLSTFSEKCFGKDMYLVFAFELHGAASPTRESSVTFERRDGIDRIVIAARPPAALCDRDITTEIEAMECYGQGTRLSLGGEYAEAISCFDRKIRVAPEPDAYIERAIAHRKSGHFGPAIEDYDAALRLKPENAVAYFDRGNVYRDLGQTQDAIRDYGEAIRIKPDMTEAYGNRGLRYLALRMFQLALQDFNKVIELHPGDRKAYVNRGATYNEMGELEQAMADFDRAILLSRSEADGFNNRGAVYFQLGRYELALDDYNTAIRLKADYYDAWTGRGLTYESMKRYTEAEDDFTNAIRLRPGSADAYEARAEARLAKGDRDGASADLEKAKLLRSGLKH